jgi:site-specific recombinase XerC
MRSPSARTALTRGAARLTVRDLDVLLERFADHAIGVLDHSPLTVRNYRYAYRIFRRYLLDPALATTPADRMFQMNAWLAWNRKRGIARYTLNMYWRSLRAFFKFLEEAEGIPNPFRGLSAPGLPERSPKGIDRDALRHILRAARTYPWSSKFLRERAVAILATLMYTGLRKRELLSLLDLTKGPLSEDASVVDLKSGWIRVIGKGRHGGKERHLALPDELLPILRSYVAERDKQGFASEAFFPSREGTPLSDVQFRRLITTVRNASGVNFSAHVLRHSFISLFHLDGTPLGVVQAAAGHARIETTAGYLTVRPEDVKRHTAKFRL